MSLTRLAREAADLQNEPLQAGTASPVDSNDPRQWVGHIAGPPNTRYAQEKFYFTIVFPENYPLQPFTLTFTTPISHPNVSDDGEAQLAELRENNWCPAFTVRSILVSLQALLSDPDLNDEESDSASESLEESVVKASKNSISPFIQRQAEITHHGRRIGGTIYGMDVSRPEYEEYKTLASGAERDKFFVENADVIRDV